MDSTCGWRIHDQAATRHWYRPRQQDFPRSLSSEQFSALLLPDSGQLTQSPREFDKISISLARWLHRTVNKQAELFIFCEPHEFGK